MMQTKPLVIIGAARSGTNMIRNVLCRLPGIKTWPCDEINYIWRYGNARFPTDEFLPEHASVKIKAYIRRQFEKMGGRNSGDGDSQWLVEKTCANSLRVGFVNEVVPEAKFIHLVRDGRAVVASAQKRWKAKLEPKYLAAKARFIPLRDIPYYGMRYLNNRVYKLVSGRSQLATWGPIFEGMSQMSATHSLEEVCARQWSESVDRSTRQLDQLPSERVYRVTYEQFIAEPKQRLREILAFMGSDQNEAVMDAAVEGVSAGSLSRWQSEIDAETLEKVMPFMRQTLEIFDYMEHQKPNVMEAA